ncbi:MAG: hypothetical protein ACFE9D_11645 [Promethearchaeota archaeon]
MFQYILANATTFTIGLLFMISTLLLGLIALYHASKQGCPERRPTIMFGIALLFFFAAHAVWTYRAAFFPTHPGLVVIFPYWQWFWILFMLGVTFIGFWSILLAHPMWFEVRKWGVILLFVPLLIVILDVVLLSNPATAEWVCSGVISDIRPDIIVILTVGLSLAFFTGLAIDFYYRKFKGYESKLVPFIVFLGLFLLLIGGLLETRVIPVCQVITSGRILMLIGLWLTTYGVLRIEI